MNAQSNDEFWKSFAGKALPPKMKVPGNTDCAAKYGILKGLNWIALHKPILQAECPPTTGIGQRLTIRFLTPMRIPAVEGAITCATPAGYRTIYCTVQAAS